jgi:hypothetical protein
MSTVEQEVERTRRLLALLIRVTGMTRAQVDAKVGQGRGFSTRILTGVVGLKHEHTLTLLQAIGVQPADFFRLLYPRPEDYTNGGSLGRLLEAMHRNLDEMDLPEPPPVPAQALPPPVAAGPLDPEGLVERIAALVRDELGKNRR